MTTLERTKIFDKTSGHCHFCGDLLVLENYANRKGGEGPWVIDHVIQRGRGGTDDLQNYLPICPKCNHLRWHRRGAELRRLIELGLVANDEVKAGTWLGAEISRLRVRRDEQNARRRKRRGKSSSSQIGP